jgi:diguanylate cyclase (GGDEF)-like protein
MSFRTWLRVFFFSIVIIPMVAVAFVLFKLTADSETGRVDAGIAAGMRNAFALYSEDANRATSALRAAARDGGLRTALLAGDERAAAARMGALLRSDPTLASIAFYSPSGERLAAAGSPDAIAPRTAPLSRDDGRRFGTLAVSVTYADGFVRDVERLSSHEVSIFRGGRRLDSTLRGVRSAPELGTPDESRNFEIDGEEYRGRVDTVSDPPVPPVEIVVFRESQELEQAISDSRLLIGVILAAVLLGALGFSALVVRALQNQIGKFLEAARRLARGDFEHPVPTAGRDEFAALGQEFNSMSEQLAAKIDEVERKRRELEETIRRVGDAFASGLDPQQVAELTLQSAVEACEARAGRALALDARVFSSVTIGKVEGPAASALEAAEKLAFGPRPSVGRELMVGSEDAEEGRRAFSAHVEGANAIAVAMAARLGSRATPRYVGVVSIGRYGTGFTREEEELLEYLTGQAVVSIENASLHETVQRQAVTDELTGLANARELHAVLDREIERSRRFASPLGLVMLDIDNFKLVNDRYGHQQGDEVLAAVASVLRDYSRDIDEPARYGGEELAVVLPQTESEGAARLAERMREAVERLRVSSAGNGKLAITASFGVASIPDSADDKGSLIAAADAALYRAKRGGKNRVERAGPVPTPG